MRQKARHGDFNFYGVGIFSAGSDFPVGKTETSFVRNGEEKLFFLQKSEESQGFLPEVDASVNF
ncbi:MAG TPA: hypothetical protein IAA80_01590 [Candidatus Gallacutalibacter pullistercoris]|nr:hypothetical protein [Candidatus Gallacutalibacter pullistercoris]